MPLRWLLPFMSEACLRSFHRKHKTKMREFWDEPPPELQALYVQAAGRTFGYVMRLRAVDLNMAEISLAPIDEEHFWDLAAMWFVRLADIDPPEKWA